MVFVEDEEETRRIEPSVDMALDDQSLDPSTVIGFQVLPESLEIYTKSPVAVATSRVPFEEEEMEVKLTEGLLKAFVQLLPKSEDM